MKKILLPILLLAALLVTTCGKKGTEPEGPPVPTIIDGPKALDVRTNSAEIYWKTDVLSSSVVYYGTESGSYPDTVRSAKQDTLHSVVLQNLQSNTTYYYVAESENESGAVQSPEMQFTTAMSFSDLVQAGWNAYEGGNYTSAIDYFLQVIDQHPYWADAYNGIGWCYASNVMDTLDAAVKYFTDAIYYDANLTASWAGRGFVFLAQNHYIEAINDLTQALSLDANFIFAHDTSITSADIHLALAEAYFYRQEFRKAQAQVDALEPDNGLDPQDSNTWTVDGTAYPSYEAALLAWIEKLKSLVG